MRTRDLRTCATAAAAALTLAGWLPATAAAQPAPAEARSAGGDTVDAASVRAAVHAFHDALAAGDSAAALELLHPEVRVFEGGHAESLSEYRSGHLAADMEFSAAVEREVLEEEVFGGGGRAVYVGEYRMAGTFQGEEIEVRGTETMALLRAGGGWRIRHIHWSSR